VNETVASAYYWRLGEIAGTTGVKETGKGGQDHSEATAGSRPVSRCGEQGSALRYDRFRPRVIPPMERSSVTAKSELTIGRPPVLVILTQYSAGFPEFVAQKFSVNVLNRRPLLNCQTCSYPRRLAHDHVLRFHTQRGIGDVTG
jgi:hypothetical protein